MWIVFYIATIASLSALGLAPNFGPETNDDDSDAWRRRARGQRSRRYAVVNHEIALTSGALLLAADRGALNAGSDGRSAQARIEQSGAAILSPLTCSEAHAPSQRKQ
jgi:hypothetical protein